MAYSKDRILINQIIREGKINKISGPAGAFLWLHGRTQCPLIIFLPELQLCPHVTQNTAPIALSPMPISDKKVNFGPVRFTLVSPHFTY